MISKHPPGPGPPHRAETTPSSALSHPDQTPAGYRIGASITLAILAAAVLLPSLFYPFARDQGVFAYVGSVILKGGAPYRDVWEVKPPGIYYLYAAVLGCTGRSMGGLRAFDLVAAVATALMLAAALRRFMAVEAAWLGALLSAALYLRLGYWGMAQTESYANLCTAAALLAWLLAGEGASGGRGGRGDGATGRSGNVKGGAAWDAERVGRPVAPSPPPPVSPVAPSVAAGLATAAALLLKVTALPPLAAALGIASTLRAQGQGWRQEAQRFAFFLLGLLPPLALAMVALARSGAGAAYLDIQRGFVAGYVALPMTAGATAAGWRYFWHLYAVPAVLATAGLLAAPAPARLLMATWLAAAIASVAMQRKYFGYHWTPVLLPLAALAGIALARALALLAERITTETRRHGGEGGKGATGRNDEPARPLSWPGRPLAPSSPRPLSVSPCLRGDPLRSGWAQRRAPVVCAVGALLIMGWSMARPANNYGATARLLTGRLPLERYWSQFGRPHHGDFSFLADRWAADYIRHHTRPTDPVYIWGFEPLTLFLAGRSAPSRFVFAVPLVAPWSPTRWREEFLRDLRAHPPVLFGVMRHDAIPWASGRRDDSAAQLETFPALRDFLHRNYRHETTIEDLTLYRRNR